MARTWMDMHRLRRLHDSQYIMKNPFTNENSNLSNIFHNNIHRKKVESLKLRNTEEFLCQFALLPCRFFRGRRQGRQPLNKLRNWTWQVGAERQPIHSFVIGLRFRQCCSRRPNRRTFSHRCSECDESVRMCQRLVPPIKLWFQWSEPTAVRWLRHLPDPPLRIRHGAHNPHLKGLTQKD